MKHLVTIATSGNAYYTIDLKAPSKGALDKATGKYHFGPIVVQDIYLSFLARAKIAQVTMLHARTAALAQLENNRQMIKVFDDVIRVQNENIRDPRTKPAQLLSYSNTIDECEESKQEYVHDCCFIESFLEQTSAIPDETPLSTQV